MATTQLPADNLRVLNLRREKVVCLPTVDVDTIRLAIKRENAEVLAVELTIPKADMCLEWIRFVELYAREGPALIRRLMATEDAA